jgi:predicted Fe-Mo cluster-binding NifX family protein
MAILKRDGDKPMKIAFTACGNSWDEQLDNRFGRTKGFFIVDTDTDETLYIDNRDNLNAAHGAGTSAAQTLAEQGIKILITGQVGPKAGSVLKTAGITVLEDHNNDSIREAYNRFKNRLLNKQKL